MHIQNAGAVLTGQYKYASISSTPLHELWAVGNEMRRFVVVAAGACSHTQQEAEEKNWQWKSTFCSKRVFGRQCSFIHPTITASITNNVPRARPDREKIKAFSRDQDLINYDAIALTAPDSFPTYACAYARAWLMTGYPICARACTAS